jgi:hypothetical protein
MLPEPSMSTFTRVGAVEAAVEDASLPTAALCKLDLSTRGHPDGASPQALQQMTIAHIKAMERTLVFPRSAANFRILITATRWPEKVRRVRSEGAVRAPVRL